MLCGGYKCMSRFEAPYICIRWTGERLSGADIQVRWHGVLKTVWLHCYEAQQVEYLRELESWPLVQDAS